MKNKDSIGVRGSFRLAIAEDGKVVEKSDWYHNRIVNLGFLNFLVKTLGGIAGSTPTVGFMGIGTGGLPAVADTSLAGEQSARAAVTAASSSSSKAVTFTATFSSSASFVTATKNISNVGLFASSAGGSLFAGNTYASSSVATNQDVYATYTITYS